MSDDCRQIPLSSFYRIKEIHIPQSHSLSFGNGRNQIYREILGEAVTNITTAD